MALKKCKECGNDVSTKAKTCPHCGASNRPSTLASCAGCLGVSILGMIVLSILMPDTGTSSSGSGSTSKTEPEKTPEEFRKEELSKHFSAWDGSHRGLTKVIKDSMNDPGSYDHVETVYWDQGDHLIVRTTFRGKNAFGGVVKNWVKAKVGLNGTVLEVIEQGQ